MNTLVFLLVASAVVLGVLSLRQEPDTSACQPPDYVLSTDAEDSKSTARAALTDARTNLRRAERQQENDPSPRNARDVRDAQKNVDSARTQVRALRPVEVIVSPTATTTFKLGNDLNSGTRSIAFSTSKPVPGSGDLAVSVTPFAPTDAGQELGPSDIVAWAELQPGRQHGTLYLCIPPDRRLEVPSGQFTGELVVEPGVVQRLAVPVTLTLANPHFTRVMLAGLAIAWAASWYVFFLRRDDLGDKILYGKPLEAEDEAAEQQEDAASRVLRWPFGFWHGYWRWVCSMSGAITVVAGTAAAVTAFSTVYLGSDTWAGSFGDWFAFCGAIATAFVAGGTAGKLAQLTPSDGVDDETKEERRRRRVRARARARARARRRGQQN